MTDTTPRKNAIITGASAGLGRALAIALVTDGWRLTVDARHPEPLAQLGRDLADLGPIEVIAGDVSDPDHRRRLVTAATANGPIDLLVNNASDLGGSPPPRLRDLTADTAQRLFSVNVIAPQQLIRTAEPSFAEGAVIINVSSDAAVEHYEGWGGYAATKAALDHLTLTWAGEAPQHTWYAVDPGDLRTAMHQAAFPGEDISDRPEPETVVPTMLQLIGSGLSSGRYRVADLTERWAPRTPILTGRR
ncbi:MAG: SDR family NAD(P)-dependent oxidoreductase [Propionibacteriaceae bacterium]